MRFSSHSLRANWGGIREGFFNTPLKPTPTDPCIGAEISNFQMASQPAAVTCDNEDKQLNLQNDFRTNVRISNRETEKLQAEKYKEELTCGSSG